MIKAVQEAHDRSRRSDLRDRVRFEHPVNDSWVSLVYPSAGRPEYRVFLHYGSAIKGWESRQEVFKYGSIGEALDLIGKWITEWYR